MSIVLFEILIVLLLVAANGIFSMSEMAVVSARKTRLQQMAEEGNKGAKAAIELADSPNRFFSTVQVGITLIGIIAGAYGGATLSEKLSAVLNQVPLLLPYSGTLSFGLVVGAITFLSLVFGELIPKRLALSNPERVASALAPSMAALARAASPIVHFLSVATEYGLKVLGVKPTDEPAVTEKEIRLLIDQGTQAGTIEETEQDLLERVFRFGDRQVSSLMTPRPDILWIDLDAPEESLRQEFANSYYSRLPVCRGEIDKVLGIVQVKDLLAQLLRGKILNPEVCLRKPLFVPETAPARQVLEKFRESGMDLALVVDEFGSIQGLVTLNDMLEALVGELPTDDEQADGQIMQREDGSWLVDGSMSLEELEHRIEPLPRFQRANYRTLGGFIMAQLGHIPVVAENVHWQGFCFEVMDMDGNRVDKVLVSLASASEREIVDDPVNS
jgi:putative hemolysin